MKLVADRFVVWDDGRAVDLATGARVSVNITSAGGVSDQLRWNARCAALYALHHRAIAPLLDFGLVGEGSRFEAWDCVSLRRGSLEDARAVHARASRFLRAMSLSAGSLSNGVQKAIAACGQWVPDASTGYPNEERQQLQDELPLADRGLERIERREVAALFEMFQPRSGTRPLIASLCGSSGSGKRRAIRDLARVARTNGFVPVAAHLLQSSGADLWRGRSLFVIAATDAAAHWSFFLGATMRTPQPHVLLLVGRHECRSVDSVVLQRVPASALVAAVRPRVFGTRLEPVATRAAERAQGMPGRFVSAVWPDARRAQRDGKTARSRISMAAEQPARYGEDEGGPVLASAPKTCTWPAPGELVALRRKRDAGLSQIAQGHHAPGMRDLRQAIGGLARRGAWTDAAAGAFGLASALLKRGRAREAHAAIEEAREFADRGGDRTLPMDLATLGGEAWIDLARPDEAEGMLGAAVAAARVARDTTRIFSSSIALARCLYWRGQFADAAALLRSSPEAMPVPLQARHGLLAARVAVAQKDFSRAMTLAAEASRLAAEANEPQLAATAACTTAFVHLAVGDWDAVDRDVATALEAAARAHDPLRSFRARLLQAEAARRRGQVGKAAALLTRLRRVSATAPALLQARWNLASALLPGSAQADSGSIIARHVAVTGLGALALYAAIPHLAGVASQTGGDAFVDDLVAIMRVCQTAEDEGVLLKEVCARVRRYLHASAVAVLVVQSGGTRIVASDGARLESDIGERAMQAGVTVAPHRYEDRTEAAAPVIYGGAPIAALCARWTVGSTHDTSRAASVLTMAAAAAAPIVAAACARREQPSPVGGCELIGAAAAMVELRRSIDRAAAAPFAVLIDGESGSGKELVARAIHRCGPRRQKPFATLNCAALPEDLVEAELFGHSRGAFTGAVADRAGVFEEAHGGTLFLDEIGELSPRAQAKVLRVIQEGELRRVGETISRRIDVRIVAATNRELRREVDAGRFRLDLLYRLDVVHVTVPPLRERREDIALLAEHFWRDATARIGSRATLSAGITAALARYDWPGNVRELQNVLASLAVRSPKRGVVPASALPSLFGAANTGELWRLDDARRTFDERFVRAALVRTGGHRGRAAAELGVTRQGLTKLMTRLGIAQ